MPDTHTSLDDINPQTDMVGKLHISGETLHTDGQAAQMLPPGFDEFSVTPRMRREGGIQDGEALRWVRNTAMWEEHEKTDRIGQFQDSHDARLVLRGKSGKPFTRGDLVLMAYPKQVQEREEAEDLRRAEAWSKELPSSPDGRSQHPENFARDPEALWELRERRRRENEKNGYVGPLSPTSGMSLEEAYRRFSAEAVAAEEVRYRRGPRGMDRQEGSGGRGAGAAAVAPARAERGSTKTTVAMGDSGFGRNPNSPLAQAQARAAKAK